MRETVRLIASWLVVLAAAAVALKALDRLPSLLTGTPPGARAYESIDRAERALGARIWLPAFYPDTLAWPPSRIESFVGPHVWAVVHVVGREDRGERLVLVESMDEPAPPPATLLPPVLVLQSSAVAIGTRQGVLSRVVTDEGRTLHEVWWVHGARRVMLRYDGAAEELLVIAQSLERTQSWPRQ
ncbi:MAG TPA: hypothetical protein VGK32_01155 [Vicinamibacterales bacterium]|jgi:hypothetical protein